MWLRTIDPLGDRRWADLVESCDTSSVFHTPQWLEALRRTYGYEPVVFTSAGAGEALDNGVVFCRVRSWMTGRRLVSLPFSDHCEPLVENKEELLSITRELKARIGEEGLYVELRPRTGVVPAEGFARSADYCHHAIDLSRGAEAVFAGFHKAHVQRTIRKALRLGVTVDRGRSTERVGEFYALHTLTRRRHGLPVQPLRWFHNLVECLGERSNIWVARVDGQPVAAMLTATHKRTLVYKYGCSDAAWHRYGGPSLLFWSAIQQAGQEGLAELDLGRSDWDDRGLLAYKDHLGARRTALTYFRYPPASSSVRDSPWWARVERMYARVPGSVQVRVGRALYRHFA